MEREQDRQWYRALACSVLLHAALLFALLRAAVPLPAPTPPAKPLTIAVSLHRGNPQQARPAAAPPAAVLPSMQPVPAPLLSPLPAVAATAPPPAVPAPTPADTGAADSATPLPTLDTDLLQASLASAAADWHRQQRLHGTLPCQTLLQPRNRNDCDNDYSSRSARHEQLQQAVTSLFAATAFRREREDRESKDLLARMATLRPLAQQDTVLGSIAHDAYRELEARYDLLNPQESHGPRADFAGPLVSETLPLLFISPTGITVLGGVLGIRFDGTLSVMGEAVDSPVRQQRGN